MKEKFILLNDFNNLICRKLHEPGGGGDDDSNENSPGGAGNTGEEEEEEEDALEGGGGNGGGGSGAEDANDQQVKNAKNMTYQTSSVKTKNWSLSLLEKYVPFLQQLCRGWVDGLRMKQGRFPPKFRIPVCVSKINAISTSPLPKKQQKSPAKNPT